MSQVLLRRLRISIAALSFITGCLLAAYYGEGIRYFNNRDVTWIVFRAWPEIVQVVFLVAIFGSYVYSVRGPAKVHKFLRAFLLLGMAGTLLYFHLLRIHVRILSGSPYACPPGYPACGLFRAVEFFTILFGFLMILEVGVTLKNGPLETRSPPKDVEIVSPLQPIQPQPYYQQQPYAYYPPQQPGQPGQQNGSSMKYEAQGPVMMQYQQPHQPYFQPQHMPPPPQQQQYYQPQQQQPQQQQQPHPYSDANYSAPPPQIPGSMVTTTPQSGGQPMPPPSSPGFSIAVSPVMPSEGYPTPLGSRSPVQPAP